MKKFPFLTMLLVLLASVQLATAQTGIYSVSDMPDAKDQPALYGNTAPATAAYNVANCSNLSAPVSVRVGVVDPAPGSPMRAGIQQGRIFRDGVAAACPQKTYPGIFNAATNYGYTTVQFVNCGTTPICLTVNFDPNTGATPCGTNAHAAVYQSADGANPTPYNPAAQSVNFIGDVGSSVTQPFAVTIKPGFFEVVFANNASVSQCTAAFSFSAVGCDAPIGFVDPSLANIKCACGTVAPPPGGGACNQIFCAGNQTVTLPPGACDFLVPNYVTENGDCAIVQTAGPAAGTAVGPGTYTLKFELRNGQGAVADKCEMTLTVQAFPNPVKSLTCNDHVNITADAKCQVTLDADMFLEGGLYGCYKNYKINIWPFNSQANAINNVPQGVALNLPLGTHTYEVVGFDGNSCWGTFTVEDKVAPVAACSCEDKAVIIPVVSFCGSIAATDSRFTRPNGFTACAAGTGTYYYDAITFQVSATGSYTFNASGSAGDTYGIIYTAPFNPLSPCTNFIAANDDTAGGLDPLITTTLTAGVKYTYVMTTFGQNAATGNYDIKITGAGQAQIVRNPADALACQFKCYDLEVVKRETVGILYNIPGNHKSKLTTPPAVTDACGAVSRSFEDKIVQNNCGASKLVRDWTFVDAAGNTSYCSQTFTFNQLNISDLTVPTREVQLTCGSNTAPEDIAGQTDVDSRTGSASAANTGIYADDWTATPAVVELHEGYPNGYYTYSQIGFDGNAHPQKVDVSVCNIYSTYTDININACGLGCGGNMKVLRTWTLLDWCTGATSTYVQTIKAVDEKAPTFDVADVTISVDPWGCVASWQVAAPTNLNDNCALTNQIKWRVEAAAGVSLFGSAPSYAAGNMGVGKYAFTYFAEDCCGNFSSKVANVTVIDASAPVAVAKQNIVLSLTGSGTGADGTAKLYGWQVDNGSYDHCSDVKVEIRRASGGACGNVGANGTHNNNSTFNDNNGVTSEVPGQTWFHNPGDDRNDTDGGEFVQFCCEDIPAGAEFGLHDVEIRVFDDGNRNGVYGDNLIINGVRDNYNTTWATIRVENKIPPVIVCPPNATVTCDMVLNLSLDGKQTNVNDVDMSMTGTASAFDLCAGLNVTYTDVWLGGSNPVCKTGKIRRTFTAVKGSTTVTCAQEIEVSGVGKAFTVNFPQRGGVSEWPSCSLSLEDVRNTANSTIKRPITDYGQCDCR